MRLAVFCGARPGAQPHFLDAARAFGDLLGRRGIGVVYGGARVGLMGAVADAALAAGGEVIGVIPGAMRDREIAHTGVTELHVVGSMHERKALMAERADGFVALPGGAGTLEEIAEAWTWVQLGIHAKPVALLNVDGFYDPLVAQVDRMQGLGFLRPADRRALLVAGDGPALLDALARWEAPPNRLDDAGAGGRDGGAPAQGPPVAP